MKNVTCSVSAHVNYECYLAACSPWMEMEIRPHSALRENKPISIKG